MRPWLSTGVAVVAAFTVSFRPAAAQPAPSVTEYPGMCDASAAIAIGTDHFVVANDEDNVFRIYRRHQAGAAKEVDLSTFLKVGSDDREADLEGVTSLAGRLYWIASHGRNSEGKERPTRQSLFATDVVGSGDTVTVRETGQPYRGLLQQLTAAEPLKKYKLDEASNLAPEAEGGLNIEGLAATPQGALLLAFRNPVPDGRALVVPLENPQDVIAGTAAKLGVPFELVLGGLGIRSIEYSETRKRFLIVAGPPGDDGPFKLFSWSGARADAPAAVPGANFQGLNPEAMFIYPGEAVLQVLSDDGGRPIERRDCKKAAAAKQRFRAVSVTP